MFPNLDGTKGLSNAEEKVLLNLRKGDSKELTIKENGKGLRRIEKKKVVEVHRKISLHQLALSESNQNLLLKIRDRNLIFYEQTILEKLD